MKASNDSSATLESYYWQLMECSDESARQRMLEELRSSKPKLASELEKMLDAASGSFMQLDQDTTENSDFVAQTWDSAPRADTSDSFRVPKQIGPYKLLEPIGEGGMGLVYLAQQSQPVRRKVAIKIIKPGMDSRQVIARFEAERQALAMMEHPNIAKVLDAGTTDAGLPYFVMELVRGIPITDYCDRSKMRLTERLQLFCGACSAIQHAHNKGIIHRDIKPSNVLVTEHDGTPVAKVIDFGVAKALTDNLTDKTLFTGVFQMLGTPLYMSPEQASLSNLDVDVRSDVYSLGVLLYELISGELPLDRKSAREMSFDQLRQHICETEPPRPSRRLRAVREQDEAILERGGINRTQLARSLAGELDWIVMKAIEKDRSRRYQSVRELSEDVRRYVEGELVEARPATLGYQFIKLTRRHRGPVAVLAAVLLALGAGLVIAMRQARIAANARSVATENEIAANAQARRAERNLQLAMEAVDQIYTDAAETILINTPESQEYRKRVLERALSFYLEFLEENSGTELEYQTAMAWRRVGEVYHRFEENDNSCDALLRAIEMFEKLALANPHALQIKVQLAETVRFLAKPYEVTRQFAKAQACCRRALAIEQELVDQSPEQAALRVHLAKSYHQLGHVLEDTEQAAQAFQTAIEILEREQSTSRDGPALARQLAHDLSHLGELEHRLGSTVAAEEKYRQALNLLTTDVGNHPNADVMDSYQAIRSGLLRNIGNLLAETERVAAAIQVHEESVAMIEELASKFPSVAYYQAQCAQSRIAYGSALDADGQTEEAQTQWRTAERILAGLAETHPQSEDYRQQQRETSGLIQGTHD